MKYDVLIPRCAHVLNGPGSSPALEFPWLGLARGTALLVMALALPAVQSQTPAPATVPSPATSSTQTPAAATPAAPAAADAQAPGLSEEPTIKTHVDEVSLDLAVRDKHRHTIVNLKPEDLAITDGDTPVKLNGLHLVRGTGSHGHLITIVFDQFTGSMAKQARQVSDHVLKTFPADGYEYAVLNFGGRLRLMQPFTEDRKAVEHAIEVVTESNAITLTSTLSLELNITTDKAEQARVDYSRAAEKNVISMARKGVNTENHNVDPVDREHAQVLLNALQDAQKIQQEQHTYRSLAGLLALVKAQQRLPERKALIYFTQNRQMDSSAKEILKNITAAATRAGVTIYAIDLDAMNASGAYELENARGNALPPFEPGQDVIGGGNGHQASIARMQQMAGVPIAGTPSTTGPQWGVKQDIQVMTDFSRDSSDYAKFAYTVSPLVKLAQDTGGIYLDVDKAFKRGLQQMHEDLNTYYEATYTPPIKDYDGSYRPINVKPLRKDLRVQAKSGYYAVPPGGEGGIRPFEAPLLKVLDGKDLPADVRFKAAVLRFGEMPDGATSTLAVEVPIHELQIKEDVHTNLYSAHASVVARIRDSHGVQVERIGEDITRRGALELLDRDRTMSIAVQRHFISAPGHYTVEVAVADQFSGKMGAQRYEFDVPDSTHAASLSDVVLVRKLDAIREEDDDPVEPLRYESSRITPNILGELPQDAKGVSLFFILHPDAAAKDDPTLEMQVVRNGTPGRRTPLPLKMGSAGMPIPYLASFGSSAMAPGDYKVIAYLNQGGKTSVQQMAFHVDGAAVELARADGAPKLSAAPAGTEPAASMVLTDLHTPGQLSIVPVGNATAPLAADEAKLLIEDARQRALDYHSSLPNFMCVQVTNRSFDPAGVGRWKLRDSIVELLRYRDQKETRTTVEVNGKTSGVDREAMKGAISAGEFGGVLKAIFSASAQAQFAWKETDALNSGTVQVFTYEVEKAHSMFSVVGSNDRQIFVGFHGQVFIDSATRSVRRLTLIADNLPKDFPTHSTRIDVDYDYVAINDHDYLVPVSAEMRLTQGKHEAVLNTMEFRNYRRYGSNMRILGFTPVENP